MKAAASIWTRTETKARRLAQKIIISHITNYFKHIYWKKNLAINPDYSLDSRYPCIPLPTYMDYEYLLSFFQNKEELSFYESLVPGLIFLPIRNVYIIEKEGKLYERKRPEDSGKVDVPHMAYLLVNRDVFKKGAAKFKSRDMFKFLHDVRAMSFPKVEKEYMANWMSKSQKKISYKDYLKDTGYSKEKINQIIRKSKKEGMEVARQSRKLSPHHRIRQEFFKDNRKKYDKIAERLREMGIPI